MQITPWNCCRGKSEVKLPHLLKINPDIVAIQESAKPAGLLGETQASILTSQWPDTIATEANLAAACQAERD